MGRTGNGRYYEERLFSELLERQGFRPYEVKTALTNSLVSYRLTRALKEILKDTVVARIEVSYVPSHVKQRCLEVFSQDEKIQEFDFDRVTEHPSRDRQRLIDGLVECVAIRRASRQFSTDQVLEELKAFEYRPANLAEMVAFLHDSLSRKTEHYPELIALGSVLRVNGADQVLIGTREQFVPNPDNAPTTLRLCPIKRSWGMIGEWFLFVPMNH